MTYLAIKLGAWALSGLACLTLLWDAHKAPDSLPKTRGQQTITLTSIVPTTTAAPATTTTVPKGCAEYVADAITAGWPADQAPMMARVMFRESRCNPKAWNGEDSNSRPYTKPITVIANVTAIVQPTNTIMRACRCSISDFSLVISYPFAL